jgi:hypothetical protein
MPEETIEDMNCPELSNGMDNYKAAWRALKCVAMYTKNLKLIDMISCLELQYEIESAAILKK